MRCVIHRAIVIQQSDDLFLNDDLNLVLDEILNGDGDVCNVSSRATDFMKMDFPDFSLRAIIQQLSSSNPVSKLHHP